VQPALSSAKVPLSHRIVRRKSSSFLLPTALLTVLGGSPGADRVSRRPAAARFLRRFMLESKQIFHPPSLRQSHSMSLNRLRSIFRAALVVLGSQGSWAAGLSAEQSGTVLGQPLNFPVQVRLDAGETLTADCVSAEVHVSDQRVQPSQVRTQLDQQGNGQARVRVQTLQAIDEPVVSITLRVGCATSITRRFVVFADPPISAAPAWAGAPASPPLVAAAPSPGSAADPASSDSARMAGGGAPRGDASSGSGGSGGNEPALTGAGSRSNAAVPSSASRGAGAAKTTESTRVAAGPAPLRGTDRAASRTARPAAGSDGPARAPASTRNDPRAAADKTTTAAAGGVALPPPGPRLSLEPLAPPALKPARDASPAVGTPREEADAIAQAWQAVTKAASAAQVASLAASASAERIAGLERTVAQMRSESQANQALIAELHRRLEQPPTGAGAVWPMLGVAAALAVLSGWLSWRLGRSQTLRQQAWAQQRQQSVASGLHTSSQALDSPAGRMMQAQSGPASFIASDLATVPPRSGLGSVRSTSGSVSVGMESSAVSSRATGAADEPGVPGTAGTLDAASRARTQGAGSADPGASAMALGSLSPRGAASAFGTPGATAAASPRNPAGADGSPNWRLPEAEVARTEPLPAPLRGGHEGVRDVSIEELIDLEQQAEFFIVLGQDEAAIDLLVDHMRSTGGSSPLPYLKLLEIYSRTNDRSAYERNRARFNHRFNAYAPEWGSDLSQGRSLEDYPGILPRLEQVWLRPLDAMAELEALLFRKSRGELFELPAYREVLFLYALARDLLDHEAVDTGTVDLLLPLSDGSSFGATAPIPFLHDETRAGDAQFDHEDPPTRPVDFDLTIPAQQTSMFDPMEGAPHLTPLRRR
jgi:pilus assembly protein FimV